MVVQDLLWIWPDRDSAAFDDCLSKQPANTPEFQQNKSFNNWHMLVELAYVSQIIVLVIVVSKRR